MKCSFCRVDLEEKLIQEHHLKPRFMDNPRGLGQKIPLCEKCHNILHLQIAAIIWSNMPLGLKEETIKKVIDYTLKKRSKKEEEKGDDSFSTIQ